MSEQRSRGLPEGFVAATLPWLVAAGGFLVYLGTLNAWVSLSSLGTVARVSGWLWQPELRQPLTFAVLYPFRFLPGAWLPLALNLFSVLCAAGVLLLLARSVALLPQDRTHEQRSRELSPTAMLSIPTAWMPPLLAALACGLQLTFWERATAITGDMINLLVFACVIWCLLEFRIAATQAWLSGGAFLYGAGMANDWTLVGGLPVFIAAVIWLKGWSFFNLRFLLRMALWGALGLSLYLLLPALQACQAGAHLSLWAALKANLKGQRDALIWFPRSAALGLALTCLLPLLVISIHWRSEGPHSGDDSRVGRFLTEAVFRFAHAAFLAVSLWMALDPPLSPRTLGLGVPLLTQYYLSALVIGYCSGYFLLLGSVPVPKIVRNQRPTPFQRFIARLTVAAFGVLLVALPVMLLWRNLGQIRTTNNAALHQFARQLYRSLPAGKSVVLSDDPKPLYLLMAEVAARRSDKNPLLLDTASLAWGQYHILKAAEFKSRWPVTPPTTALERVDPGHVVQLISRFAAQEPVTYLHPSFSACYELFADRPNGPVHCLVPRTADSLDQALDPRTAAANDQYWQTLWSGSLHSLAALANPKPLAPRQPLARLAARLSLSPEQNRTAAFLAGAYAKSLNDWGVRLQRLGRWQAAGQWFQRALELKPDNLAARVNLEFNAGYQQGNRQRLDRESVQKQYLDLFAEHRNWAAVINDDGPVDEPTFLFETGRVLLTSGKPHQAVQEFARCAELAPDWREPKLWLAQGHVLAREFTSALDLTDAIQAAGLPPDGAGLAQFLFCRATALEALSRTNEAAACIASFVAQHPEQAEVLATAAQLDLQSMQYEAALAVLDRLLAREPQNPELLSNKGLAEMQLARYPAAIATLTSALVLAPSNQVVRLNRAIASLHAGDLDAAQADYQQLLNASPRSYKVLFGLGEIAWRRQDTNAAVQFYQQCLSLGLPESAEGRLVADRLNQLKGGGAK